MRVFGRVMFYAALAAPVLAQVSRFEVVSIKPSTSDPRNIRLRVLPGGRLWVTGLPVRALLVYAYRLPINPSERFSGAPDWVNGERYDIEAKAPDGAFPPGLPSSEADAKMRGMMQSLLADRFRLKMRRETREMAIYALAVARGGPKLPKATIDDKDCATAPTDRGPGCHEFMGGQGRGLHAKAVDMKDLAGYIENWTDHPVVDRTGLNGLFAMDTEGWTSMRAPPAPESASTPNPLGRPSGDGDMSDPSRPTLFMVLQRLGLELKRQKGPVDVYFIEHIERPAVN